jgi:hypothetical protein
LIEALQAGDKAMLAKFAADQSYSSNSLANEGSVDTAQDANSLSEASPVRPEGGRINSAYRALLAARATNIVPLYLLHPCISRIALILAPQSHCKEHLA